MFCSECLKPCDEVERDFGFGVTECWGAMSSHENKQWVSECCEADLLEDLEEQDE